MNGLLSLVCCAEFLVALLLIPACTRANPTDSSTQSFPVSTSITLSTAKPSQSDTPSSSISSDTTTITSSKGITTAAAATTAPTDAPTTTTTLWGINVDKCFLVAGGLIIGCVILLMSTLLLACKVCSLSRRLKALSSNSDMVSNREYWMGNDNEDKNKSEARETTVLMTDITQTQEEMSNGAATEEGGKAKEDGQTAGEKEEGDGAVNEEASAAPAAAESSPSPNPQEEAASSEPSNAAAAPASSDGKEEPKDGQ